MRRRAEQSVIASVRRTELSVVASVRRSVASVRRLKTDVRRAMARLTSVTAFCTCRPTSGCIDALRMSAQLAAAGRPHVVRALAPRKSHAPRVVPTRPETKAMPPAESVDSMKQLLRV